MEDFPAPIRDHPDDDHNIDRYRDPVDTLRELLDHPDLPLDSIDRLEMGWLASGEVTCRLRRVGSEDWDILILGE